MFSNLVLRYAQIFWILSYDAIPHQVIIYQTPSFLHPNLQAEKWMFDTMYKGQTKSDTQLCNLYVVILTYAFKEFVVDE